MQRIGFFRFPGEKTPDNSPNVPFFFRAVSKTGVYVGSIMEMMAPAHETMRFSFCNSPISFVEIVFFFTFVRVSTFFRREFDREINASIKSYMCSFLLIRGGPFQSNLHRNPLIMIVVHNARTHPAHRLSSFEIFIPIIMRQSRWRQWRDEKRQSEDDIVWWFRLEETIVCAVWYDGLQSDRRVTSSITGPSKDLAPRATQSTSGPAARHIY